MKALSARIEEISNRYGLPVDPRRLVHALSVFTPFRLIGREWEERKIQERLRRMQH